MRTEDFAAGEREAVIRANTRNSFPRRPHGASALIRSQQVQSASREMRTRRLVDRRVVARKEQCVGARSTHRASFEGRRFARRPVVVDRDFMRINPMVSSALLCRRTRSSFLPTSSSTRYVSDGQLAEPQLRGLLRCPSIAEILLAPIRAREGAITKVRVAVHELNPWFAVNDTNPPPSSPVVSGHTFQMLTPVQVTRIAPHGPGCRQRAGRLFGPG